MNDINVASVLKTGGVYNARYAHNLFRSAGKAYKRSDHFGFTILTDDPEMDLPPMFQKPLAHGWPRWWSLMELYKLRGPVIAVGLDTVFVRDFTPLVAYIHQHPKEIIGMRDVYRGGKNLQTSLMAWGGDVRYIYEAFKANAENIMNTHRGDQEWLNHLGIDFTPVQDIWPGGVLSYKAHCRQMGGSLPESTAIVVFHGRPRPHEVKNPPWWMSEWQ